jgi:O-antigen/teichoic acid export membrane protein
MSREKAARAGVWSAADIVLRQGVQFVISVVLARLLSPADFGLMVLLAFFTSLSIVFVQGGLSLALIQRQVTSHEEESAVFWCNLGASVIFGLILIAIGPLIARFYGYPLLQPLMFVAAAQVVLSALGAVHTALLTRALRFDQLTLSGVVSSVISGGLGVAAALNGYGVWALAIQLIATQLVSSATLWWISAWRPSLRFSFAAIRDLYGFGFYVSLSSTLEVLTTNGFNLVIGKLYGVNDLGFLSRAAGVQSLPGGIMSTILARTALPLFAARQSDPVGLKRGFAMTVSLAMLVSVPMMAGLAALSDPIIEALFGAKWLPAAPLLTILAAGGVLLPLHVLNLNLLLSQGHSKAFFRLEIQKKAVGIAMLAVGCFYGVIGVCIATSLFGVVALIINARPTARSISYGVVEQLWDLRGIAAATAVMLVLVLGLKQLLQLSAIPEIAVLSSVGAAAYCAFGFIFRISHFTDALTTARLLLRRSGKGGEAEAPGTA